MIKRFIFLSLAFCALAPFCQKQTDGFAVGKVSTLLLDGRSSEMSIPAQTFRYLGKGGQSYVFVSEDNRYILKLFRSSRLNTLKFFLPFRKTKIELLENDLRETLQSYLIAGTYLKEETGLVAIHLDHTPILPFKSSTSWASSIPSLTALLLSKRGRF